MLLVEYSILDNVKVINESKNGVTKLKLLGKFQKCDEQNNNGRVYPRKILESQVKAIQGKIDERSLVGALDHPANDAIHLSQASHLITKLWVEKNGDVMGEAEILSTPNGKIVKALIGDGVKIGISSRGLGSVSESREGKVVNEDFKLITFDLVSDPSTKGAFPELTESMRENSNRAQTIISKHKKDRVLMTMLESKINESLSEGTPGQIPDIPANKKILAVKKPTAKQLAAARDRDRKADARRAAARAAQKAAGVDVGGDTEERVERAFGRGQGRRGGRERDDSSTSFRNDLVNRLKEAFRVNNESWTWDTGRPSPRLEDLRNQKQIKRLAAAKAEREKNNSKGNGKPKKAGPSREALRVNTKPTALDKVMGGAPSNKVPTLKRTPVNTNAAIKNLNKEMNAKAQKDIDDRRKNAEARNRGESPK